MIYRMYKCYDRLPDKEVPVLCWYGARWASMYLDETDEGLCWRDQDDVFMFLVENNIIGVWCEQPPEPSVYFESFHTPTEHHLQHMKMIEKPGKVVITGNGNKYVEDKDD